MTPGFRILFIDFGGFSGSGFAAKFTIGYYLSFLAILWVSVCLILSVKNLLSAYALAAKGCTVFHPRLRSVCGFVYFDCTITDVVSAGPALVVKVFGIRMFLPILILQATTALEPYIPGGLLIPATIKKACFLIAAFSIMPLAKTDLNNMLYLLTRSTRDFYQSLSYLGKRYVFRTENLPEQPKGANDFSIVIALLSFVWLAGMGSFLWSAAQAGFMYLAESFAGGISLETAYIPLQLATMLVPFVILVVMAVSVGASNVQYILRAPVHQLVALSEKMQKAPASGHILSFLRHLPLFSALNDDQLARLCERFNIVNYRPGRNIILQGTAGDSFFIIVSGKCRVVIEDMAGVRRVVSVLSTGDCFGEIALIDKVPRTATVIAASAVSLLRLGRRDFEEFLTALPTERKRITDTIRRGKILMSIPLFSYLSPDQISFLIDRCSAETFKKDEVVFRQGDAGDKFYIIQEGLVTITRVEDNKPVLVKTLARGSVFGEIALVKHLPRTAQAAAASDLTVLSVGKECFYELIGKNLLTGAEIDRLADRRMAEIGKGSAVVT
jgi:CRP-like cAMP-binding protein